MLYWHVIAAKMAFIIVVEVRGETSSKMIYLNVGEDVDHIYVCLFLLLTARCLLHQIHPVLRHPRCPVRSQRTNQTGEVPDPSSPPRDQPEAGDQQTLEPGPR